MLFSNATALLLPVSNIISKYCKNFRFPLDLKNLAKSSVGIHSDSLVTQMLMIIDQIKFFSKQIDVIEQDIEKEINFIDTPLMTIPGIAFTISSTILGKINFINRFKDSSKFLVFCGLNPTIHQSEQYLSSHSFMSKRGSHYLRYAILKAASLIWINAPYFNVYYHKKK